MVVLSNVEVDVLPAVASSDGAGGNDDTPQAQANWATNIVYSAKVLHEVRSVEEIQTLLRSPDLQQVTPAGTGHTFNFLADNLHARLSLRLLAGVVALDASGRTVVVDAGIRYDQLCPYLDSRGFALPNLASLTQISVAGAISTAAHGSGDRNGSLATAVRAVELVTAGGDIVKLARGADDCFPGAVVGLGALGVITRLTLAIEPAFTVRQFVYEHVPFAQVAAHFDAVMSSGDSVSLFTNWRDGEFYQMWIKVRDGDGGHSSAGGQRFPAAGPPPPTLFGATLQTRDVNFIPGLPPQLCTEQMGVAGPAFRRLPHIRTLPVVGAELQSEYFVPRYHAPAALLAVERLRERVSPLLLESEVRTIARDDLWMSMCYGRDSVAIHFGWLHDWPAVERVLPVVEAALAPFQPRPHWGKLFAMAPHTVRASYEKLDDFVRLAARLDPGAKFRNPFLSANVFAPS